MKMMFAIATLLLFLVADNAYAQNVDCNRRGCQTLAPGLTVTRPNGGFNSQRKIVPEPTATNTKKKK